MLTIKSGIDILTGYQAQQDVSTTPRSSNGADRSSSAQDQPADKVKISRKAKELQQVYQGKKNALDQNYNSESQQLEREYLQAKNKLEREFNRKKQSLDINVYA